MSSVQELLSLSGRVALVTGGAGHIGSTICDALAEVGANVVILDRSEEACVHVAREISTKRAVEVMPLVVDLADEAKVRQVAAMVTERFRRLDIVVNCAAFVGSNDLKGWATAFIEQDFGTWRTALEVNLTAPILLIQSCVSALKASGHGSIINIGSTYGVGGPDWRLYEGTTMGQPAAYAASKGGLIQMTRWLSTVLAPEIRVNAISPGGIWRNQPASFRKKYEARTPLGRMAEEEDLKGAIVYFASDLSAYVTGQNLMVDGGWTAW